MTAEDFLEKLGEGAIVCANICSEVELALAKASGQFFESSTGTGYVIRDSDWLTSREDAYFNLLFLNHLNSRGRY